MAKWFCLIEGNQVGPIESAKVKQLAEAGTLKPQHKVRREDMAEWHEAREVKGLFATQIGVTASKAVEASGFHEISGAGEAVRDGSSRDIFSVSTQKNNTAGIHDDDASGVGAATKIVFLTCLVISLPVFGFFIWYVAIRDTWELTHADSAIAKLNQAEVLQTRDPVTAYRIYGEVIDEAKKHAISDGKLVTQLAAAEARRASLRQQVQDKLHAQEVERQRQAGEAARQKVAEEQRLAEKQRQQKVAAEAERVVEQERAKEVARLKQTAAVYRDAPQSARNALNAMKKIAARVEVGVNYTSYSDVVGENWAEVKIFVESEDGKKLPNFCALLIKAVADYKVAAEIWGNKIRFSSLYDKPDVDALQQECWLQADICIKLAEGLLNSDDPEAELKKVSAGLATLADLDVKWKVVQKNR